ncbi:MAG TPA: F0F1 ATP synthase subunit A [Thermomicrobiales bacterium]|nr:F0F1 ATP synthase subunit A [Thermomicrobiales bacterium]
MEVHVEIAAETLFEIGPVAVTNSMLTMFMVMAAILVVFSLIARKASMIPGRGQGVIELIIEFLLGLVEGTAGRRVGRRIFPLIAGIFIFILFANFSGLLPGVGTIVYEHHEEVAHVEEAVDPDEGELADPSADEVTEAETEAEGAEHATGSVAVETDVDEAEEEEAHGSAIPVLRPPTADLNMTLAMSLLTFIVVQVAGISAHGVVGRIKHMGDPPFIFPIEVISEFSRIVSLAARLFGNVFAGEVLLAVMYSLANAIKIAIIPVVFPVVFIGLEVLFGTIQALVFALLTLIYIALATAGHDEHGHIEEGQVDETVESSSNRNAAAPVSGD